MTYNLLTTTRHPLCKVLALEADGVTTFLDVSQYVQYYQTIHSDQQESHKLTLTVSNAQGFFDIYGSMAGADVFPIGRIISMQIGFLDSTTNTEYFWPAFYGKVTASDWEYKRLQSDLFQVTVFDLMYQFLTEVVTTNPFYNQQINLIASDILQQYGQRTATNFYALDQSLPFVQFPGLTVSQAWYLLYGLVLYFVWFDYSGNLATFPQVGTAASGSPALIGWPDAVAPPPSGDVAFTFPDGSLTINIKPSNRIFTFVNQVTVLGQALDETITYGPVQLLTQLGNANTLIQIPKAKGATFNVSLTEQSQGSNLLTATGVYASVFCPNFHNSSGGNAHGSPDNIKLMCSDPTAVTPEGTPVPLGPFESNGHDNDNNGVPGVIATDNNGHDMGMLFLNVPINPGLSIWQSVPFGAYANSNNNGWTFFIDLFGRPVISSDATLTLILDYNPLPLTLVSAVDVFGDHRTYQVENSGNSVQPLAMGTPVEVYVNYSALPAATTLAANVTPAPVTTPPTKQIIQVTSATGFTTPGSPPTVATMNAIVIDSGDLKEYAVIQAINGDFFTLGGPLEFAHSTGATIQPVTLVISADGVNISQLAQIDFEQGQVVFLDMTYKDYSEDDATSHPFSTGGTATSTSVVFDLTFLSIPAPEQIFQTYRQTSSNTPGTSFTYTISGLEFGRGYTIILSYGDPTIVPANSTEPQSPNLPTSGAGFRVFDIAFNNGFIDTNFDTWVNANGSAIASTKTYQGITCDLSGVITITFTNGTPPSGTPSGQRFGNALVSAIEIYDPQGIEATGVVINCGGPAINPTPPTVNVTAAYSENQQQFGIKNQEINNPLLSTIAECEATGSYTLNQQAWQRNPVYLSEASIPTITPAQIIKYFNPRVGPNGADQWAYVQQITRTGDRSDITKPVMIDEYNCFLVYSQDR